MALDLVSPENSFIQFQTIADADAGIETCNTILQKCLPIHFGYDFAFQLYVSGNVASYVQDNYVVKITDTNGNIVSDVQPLAWVYDSVANISYANLDTAFDITALIALGNGACANFKIYVTVYNYAYSSIDLTGVNTITVKLYIDGVITTLGTLSPGSTIDNLVTLINNYFAANSITALATHTFSSNINIQSTDGHLYGNLVIDKGAGGLVSYPATATLATSTAILISNCIQYVADPCFTTIIKYKGNDNQFGFNYTDVNFYNSARMRMYYDSPQPFVDENFFLLSDGTKKILSARYGKEYTMHVDFSDEQRHFALAAAIKHDTVLMGRDTAAQEYSCEGKYDIAWLNKPGTNIDSAPGSFPLRPTPFFQVNSNCISGT